jgi:hypothetical protein
MSSRARNLKFYSNTKLSLSPVPNRATRGQIRPAPLALPLVPQDSDIASHENSERGPQLRRPHTSVQAPSTYSCPHACSAIGKQSIPARLSRTTPIWETPVKIYKALSAGTIAITMIASAALAQENLSGTVSNIDEASGKIAIQRTQEVTVGMNTSGGAADDTKFTCRPSYYRQSRNTVTGPRSRRRMTSNIGHFWLFLTAVAEADRLPRRVRAALGGCPLVPQDQTLPDACWRSVETTTDVVVVCDILERVAISF